MHARAAKTRGPRSRPPGTTPGGTAVAATAPLGIHASQTEACRATSDGRRRRRPLKCRRRPRKPCEDAGSDNYLDQLHFWVPVTVCVSGVPPGPVSAVNVTLYGRLPPLQATE